MSTTLTKSKRNTLYKKALKLFQESSVDGLVLCYTLNATLLDMKKISPTSRLFEDSDEYDYIFRCPKSTNTLMKLLPEFALFHPYIGDCNWFNGEPNYKELREQCLMFCVEMTN